MNLAIFTLLTKTTAAQNEVALSYHRVRGLYFLAVVFVSSIVSPLIEAAYYIYHVMIGRPEESAHWLLMCARFN